MIFCVTYEPFSFSIERFVEIVLDTFYIHNTVLVVVWFQAGQCRYLIVISNTSNGRDDLLQDQLYSYAGTFLLPHLNKPCIYNKDMLCFY